MNYRTLIICCAVIVFIAGAIDGLIETLQHHYGAFASKFPTANPYWWNPELSWQNKGDGILSRTLFVPFSDAYHFFRLIWRWLFFAGSGLAGYLAPAAASVWLWRYVGTTTIICLAAYSSGFYIVYLLLSYI
jgi:hypothetical protein